MILKESLCEVPDISGMTATADVLTGTRSILTYLMKPVGRAFSGALTQR